MYRGFWFLIYKKADMKMIKWKGQTEMSLGVWLIPHGEGLFKQKATAVDFNDGI